MAFVFKADRIFVGGAKSAANVLLDFNFAGYRAAVDVDIEDRQEDNNLAASTFDKIVVVDFDDILNGAVGGRHD